MTLLQPSHRFPKLVSTIEFVHEHPEARWARGEENDVATSCAFCCCAHRFPKIRNTDDFLRERSQSERTDRIGCRVRGMREENHPPNSSHTHRTYERVVIERLVPAATDEHNRLIERANRRDRRIRR